ncbi:MAG: bifunctional diaminohydroxyphosphoribosylaminopyrimidine deaminase/5-amino-6-(5-phosphoribosylamino)uracil reductase RibD [Candidatus Eremiobacteraeota bacterium]|nr:bifunctional diaminohydroxyphosphoribosylaminopyrimidine deaminase/5-amino-6-(5-phosphoribosylamino)uracil reductase RibD [Candidatus Eremiobacteraeota bacterium]
MEGRNRQLNALDRLYLERACELAARGLGNTSPNPPVGAVIVSNGRTLGEGYHHYAGDAHAEVCALREAGDARGATIYVSLEPCDHYGRTPPCSQALIDAGIARVVVGAVDPNVLGAASGVETLRSAGVEVEVADLRCAAVLIEPFAYALSMQRPYISLKMAASRDGYIAERSGRRHWLTGEESREFVRDLRIDHDAVMVGAGTIRVDNPRLTVRPAHHRAREYGRIVVCESDPLDCNREVFASQSGYSRTIVIAPGGLRSAFRGLEDRAELLFVGESPKLDLSAAMRALRHRGIQSILCEGGPTLAGGLIDADLVDRVYWLTAPMDLAGPDAVPMLRGHDLRSLQPSIRYDRVEQLGTDMMQSGVFNAR